MPTDPFTKGCLYVVVGIIAFVAFLLLVAVLADWGESARYGEGAEGVAGYSALLITSVSGLIGIVIIGWFVIKAKDSFEESEHGNLQVRGSTGRDDERDQHQGGLRDESIWDTKITEQEDRGREGKWAYSRPPQKDSRKTTCVMCGVDYPDSQIVALMEGTQGGLCRACGPPIGVKSGRPRETWACYVCTLCGAPQLGRVSEYGPTCGACLGTLGLDVPAGRPTCVKIPIEEYKKACGGARGGDRGERKPY